MDKKQTAGIRSDENSEVQQNFADILKKAEPGSAFILKKPELSSGFSLSGETGLHDLGGTRFRVSASSSRGGTQFRGICFPITPGRSPVPGTSSDQTEDVRSGRNSVPGVSASSSRSRTQFRGAICSCVTELSFGCCFLDRRTELSSGGICFLIPGRNPVPGTSSDKRRTLRSGRNSVPRYFASSSRGGS